MANVRIKYNRSLKMSPGKMAAQAVHAALRAYGIDHGSVVVLEGTATQVKQMDVQIHDAGLTEIPAGSLTAGASLEPVKGYDDTKDAQVAHLPKGKYRVVETETGYDVYIDDSDRGAFT